MTSTYQQAVLKYFSAKAPDYDAVDRQPYWRLSDELLWWLLGEQVLSRLPRGGRVLDAGGGTGRWTIRILQARPDTEVTLLDLSPEMLAVASEKVRGLGVGDRVRFIRADLDIVEALPASDRVDLAICFHNVLGFVGDPAAVVGRLCGLLAPRGQLALVVPNRYHAAYFSLRFNRASDARAAVEHGRGRFTVEMPSMSVFTPGDLAGYCERNGMDVRLLTGFPTLIYPGHDETQLFGSTPSLLEMLSDPGVYDTVLDLERQAIMEPGIAARGNNLFLAAQRRD